MKDDDQNYGTATGGGGSVATHAHAGGVQTLAPIGFEGVWEKTIGRTDLKNGVQAGIEPAEHGPCSFNLVLARDGKPYERKPVGSAQELLVEMQAIQPDLTRWSFQELRE